MWHRDLKPKTLLMSNRLGLFSTPLTLIEQSTDGPIQRRMGGDLAHGEDNSQPGTTNGISQTHLNSPSESASQVKFTQSSTVPGMGNDFSQSAPDNSLQLSTESVRYLISYPIGK